MDGRPRDDNLRCSFCNKSQQDVRKLIAGPTVYICDECVGVCVDIIVDDTRFEGGSGQPMDTERSFALATKREREREVCSLCGKSPTSGDMLPIEGRGLLCGDCADAIEDVLSRGRPIE